MIREGQIVLFPCPHEDWLICMVSSQLRHEIPGVDEIIHDTDSDFANTGLKTTSVIRIARLAAVSADILQGAIGSLAEQRLVHIRTRIANWITGSVQTEEKQSKGTEQPIQPGK